MLIEFSVANFLSFRERQTFSMVAAPRMRKKGNTFKAPVIGEKLPDLLKVAAIYGPNASGKSNLIAAMQVFTWLTMGEGLDHELTGIKISPFRFDKDLHDQPSEFEVHFIQEQQRYEFNLAVTAERVTYERLIAYPKGKETLLYERRFEDNGYEYVIGSALEGGPEVHNVWKQVTSSKRLFLGQAIANSSESLTQLRAPHGWLKSGLLAITKNLAPWAKTMQELAQGANKEKVGALVSAFLRELDVPVSSLRVINSDSDHDSIHSKLLEFSSKDKDKTRPGKTKLTHTTALGSAEFDLDEESDGTRNLIGFWVPWFLLQQGAPVAGFPVQSLVCDEIDSSLHPLIVQSLVSKQLECEHLGQLIFTTHDTHLMDSKILRRDQFWLTERDMNGATQLRCIHDFEGREGEDIEKRYFKGVYRGLPIVQRKTQ